MSDDANSASLPPIDRDEDMNRTYIPLPGQWEIQTKGRGSTFRIADIRRDQRYAVFDTTIHKALEQMANDIRSAYEKEIAPSAGLKDRIEKLEAKIENAAQAMSETQPSWERRCHAIVTALGFDFGGPTPDIPEQSGWYARNLKMAQEDRVSALIRATTAETRLREMEAPLSGDAARSYESMTREQLIWRAENWRRCFEQRSKDVEALRAESERLKADLDRLAGERKDAVERAESAEANLAKMRSKHVEIAKRNRDQMMAMPLAASKDYWEGVEDASLNIAEGIEKDREAEEKPVQSANPMGGKVF